MCVSVKHPSCFVRGGENIIIYIIIFLYANFSSHFPACILHDNDDVHLVVEKQSLYLKMKVLCFILQVTKFYCRDLRIFLASLAIHTKNKHELSYVQTKDKYKKKKPNQLFDGN